MQETNEQTNEKQETIQNQVQIQKKEYESPACEQHQPLDHVRAYRDKSSELVY